MTELIGAVHVATLHDALQRAGRVAPTKGAGYDRAAGFHITFGEDHANIRASNLDVTYLQRVPAEVPEPGKVIRLPSTLLAGFVGSLPMGGEQQVQFLDADKGITVRFGKTKTKATMQQITGDYPMFEWHDTADMTPAQELASHIEQVAWATEDTGILQGVRIDGTHLTAISHRRAARVACEVTTDEPVVAVLGSIVPLIKLGTDIRMKAVESKIILALDDTTQVTATVMMGAWPNLIERLQGFELPGEFTISKTRWAEGLNRLLVFVRNDRLPRMTCHLADGTMDMSLKASVTGDVQDVCALASHEGPAETFHFNPQSLLEALAAFPGGTVKIRYGAPTLPFLMSDPGSSFEAWVMGIDPRAMA